MSAEIVADMTIQVKAALREQVERAAEAIGMQAAGYAQMLCPWDTGFLRNSITWAVSGKQPEITTYKSNATDKAGNVIDVKAGQYQGTAPRDDNVAVYIGTNVYYAAYQELGFRHHITGKQVGPQPFLRPAIERHRDEYKQMAAAFLRG